MEKYTIKLLEKKNTQNIHQQPKKNNHQIFLNIILLIVGVMYPWLWRHDKISTSDNKHYLKNDII